MNQAWTNSECSKYYLCLDGEVFEFRCSEGLLFDVTRQICDFRALVADCDLHAAEPRPPKPLLGAAGCGPGLLACADATCLPRDHFCDGTDDCIDSSDEGWCDVENDPNAAPPCNPARCQLPDCFCSKDGTQIPGGLDPAQTPQMLIITFDDAVNPDNMGLYTDALFNDTRRNPNNCPARATFFLSHEYTHYQHVQKLWNAGHEIAVHSITHRSPESWWSRNATIEDWFDEMVGQANVVNRFGGVRLEEVRGLRAPFLRSGGNRQFAMMREFGFLYDASLVAPVSDPPLWPYTLDFRLPHRCSGNNQNCPSRSFPGVWEMVMNQMQFEGFTCGMVDSCPPNLSGTDILAMLKSNFGRHYRTNRAPLGLYFHSTWFKREEYLSAFQKFLNEAMSLPDVWVVTNFQAIQWMRKPTPVSQLNAFKPWQCDRKVEPEEQACNFPRSCRLQSRPHHAERYLYTCTECPKQYPWLRNEFGSDFT
ncbi:hypothetical protein B566_EDAN008583 [Ephemera danica]|nr:hypothetical protein B566_EDAN008583 [Ephemera danica]